jgi:hypothetical protein
MHTLCLLLSGSIRNSLDLAHNITEKRKHKLEVDVGIGFKFDNMFMVFMQ